MAEIKIRPNDYIERQTRSFSWELDFPISAAAAMALPTTAAMSGIPLEGWGMLAYLPLFFPAIKVLYHSVETVHDYDHKDPQLGYRALNFIFRGEQLKKSGVEVHGGDNLVYIQMPSITSLDGQKPSTKEQENLIIDTYDEVFREVRGVMDETDKFVVLELPDEVPNKLRLFFARRTVVKKKEIFQQKQAVASHPDRSLIIFTPEEFKKMEVRPQKLFQRECQILQDQVLEEYLSLISIASNPEEKQRLQQMVEERLRHVLGDQIAIVFNEPQLNLEKGINGHPQKRKVEKYTVVQKVSGEWCVQSFSSTGFEGTVRLKTIFNPDKDRDGTEINDNLRKAEAAYTILKLLEQHSLEDLLRESPKTKEELLEQMTQEGITTNFQRRYGLKFMERFRERYKRGDGFIDLHQSFKKHVLRRRLALPFASLVLLATSLPLSIAEKDASILTSYIPKTISVGGFGITTNEEPLTPPLVLEESSTHTPDFPKGDVVNSTPEWYVYPSGNGVLADGYYSLSTSNNFNAEGNWEFNTKRIGEFKQKDTSENNININLSRFTGLKYAEPTRIKIPIKDGTELRKVDVFYDRQPIEAKIFTLEDGTVEVEIEPGRAPWVMINAVLEPSSYSQVHATRDLVPIDRLKLGDEAGLTLRILEGIEGETFEGHLAELIRISHKYSLIAPPNFKTEARKSPENFINTADEQGVCTCDICNTELVLMSSLGGEVVNMAHGFLYGRTNAESLGRYFLRTGARHAYGINQEGDIYDGTPYFHSEDALTQQYVAEMSSYDKESYEDILKEYDNWLNGNRHNEVKYERWFRAQRFEEGLQTLKILSLVGLGFLGANLSYMGILWLKKAVDLRKMGDKFVGINYTSDELNSLYNFFNWLSWAGEGGKMGKERIISDDPKVVLEEIRKTANNTRLRQHPGLGQRGLKGRLLGYYLSFLT